MEEGQIDLVDTLSVAVTNLLAQLDRPLELLRCCVAFPLLMQSAGPDSSSLCFTPQVAELLVDG